MPSKSGCDHYAEQRVLCPFLHSIKGQTISCEGFCEGSRVSTTFSTRKKYQKHLSQFCESWDYESCPVNGMVTHAKYRQ